jgi:hypothetical protein
VAIDQAELDAMKAHYQAAVEQWIGAIRAEEALAAPAEYSEAKIDQWEAADRTEEQARNQAKAAKAAYESALREEFFNF